MANLTKEDFKKALKELATKKDLEKLATKDDLKPLATKSDIKAIHEDLIKHDERANQMMGMIQELGDTRRLGEKVERIREVLREKLHAEV